ncbi:MAG TPA: IscS subfamily cysteine desulfurase [Chitinophagaceae bacterium]|nr:IscS subfamily cysteine desulfurase [Chitinophagaceae bacterium]
MLRLPIYMDYNATTPCDERVVQAMLPYFTESFGNAASRSHAFGWKASEAVEYAREQVAELIGAIPQEVIFTSGATESCNLAIKGVCDLYASKGNHIITTEIEHKAVIDTCRQLEKTGTEVTYLKVNTDGFISVDELQAAIRPSTILLAVMYANNEIGVVQPMREISAIAKRSGVIFFADATQAIGKIPVDVQADGIDLMAFSAHKMYGPKGCGALYVRRKNPRVRLTAQLHGGGHERDMRSGTLNVPGIVGMGAAAALSLHHQSGEMRFLRDKLEERLLKIEGTHVNGSRQFRLPNTVNIAFEHVDGNALLIALQKDMALSSGSACTSASLEPSYVLKAIGLKDELAKSSLRFSVGRYTNEEEINYVTEKVSEAVINLRKLNPLKHSYD